MRQITVIEITLCVVLVLHQPQVSSCVETTATGIDIPVEVTGVQPVIVLENVNWSR